MSRSKIQWTNQTWNPLRGCSVDSPGCHFCYAAFHAARFSRPGLPFEGFAEVDDNGRAHWTGKVEPMPAKLVEPLRWQSPRLVFVNSMCDLFHEAVPDDYIAAVFGVMAACPQHTFQILTKRAERLHRWFEWYESNRNYKRYRHPELIEHAAFCVKKSGCPGADRLFVASNNAAGRNKWPLENVWLGVSVEDQKRADRRIPYLAETPASTRFLSLEPLLENVTLRFLDRIDWVIVGGESGGFARPCDIDWIESLIERCRLDDVPIFVKQLGANVEANDAIDAADYFPGSVRLSPGVGRGNARVRLNDAKGGDPNEWPKALRVRQYPEAASV